MERRWATRIVVRPRMISRSVAWIASSVVVSTAEVASSSTRTAGIGEDRAGEGDALALAAGERQTALADHGVEAVGQRLDELERAGGGRGRGATSSSVASGRP